MTILYVALAGVAGTLARYGLQGVPAGTLIVNLTGSLAVGFIARYATGSTVISPELRSALTVGFCGAFTTMSTFSYESLELLSRGDYWRAGLYMGGRSWGAWRPWLSARPWPTRCCEVYPFTSQLSAHVPTRTAPVARATCG